MPAWDRQNGLPPSRARTIFAHLRGYTARPSSHALKDCLSGLNDLDETLVVLNHPLWDEAGIGAMEHVNALRTLLECCGGWIHALELNGLRAWHENLHALEVARTWGLPVVSGGDRHALEPSAILNLTAARSFSEFASEVRRDGLSHVLFLDQYRQPLRLRWLETVRDTFRSYPGTGGYLQRWGDRFYYADEGGTIRPLSRVWPAGTGPLRLLFSFFRIADSTRVRAALRMMLADRAQVLPG